jgi:hypothetical protein
VSRLLRPLISLAFLGGSLWIAFSVKLGGRTFAEHVDRIGSTPEARDLVDGTRATINPVLQEATDRMLGEHIEAPTRTPEPKPTPTHTATARPKPRPQASSRELGKLPGQR